MHACPCCELLVEQFPRLSVRLLRFVYCNFDAFLLVEEDGIGFELVAVLTVAEGEGARQSADLHTW